MARKAFAVNEAMRERVRYLAGVGVRQDDIAKIIGCAPKTLRKRLRDELDRGVAEANATVSGYLFASAKAGNVTAQIFWLKVRAHWREKTTPDDPVPGSDAEANSPVLLVLPDKQPRSRADGGAARRTREIFRQETAAAASRNEDSIGTGTRADRKYRGHSPREWS